MDLLNEYSRQEPEKPKGRTLVLILLILSILLSVVVGVIMVYLESNKVIPTTVYINGEEIEVSDGLIMEDSTGNEYIVIETLTDIVGYEFYNSEYKNYGVDTTKCYIKNNNLISGFELGSNKIYKYEEGTNLDYQYYTLNCEILTYQDKLYIALEDLPKALNMYCKKDQNNRINIDTMDHLASEYQERLKDQNYEIVTDQNNRKALAYGWIIVKKNGLYSVLNSNLEEIVGSKYTSIYFDEYNLNYIVSNSSNQYGIISSKGTIQTSLKFDGMEILNYENMLYKVKSNNLYGIMKLGGTMLTNIIYEDIGSPADSNNKILYTLIIPDLEGEFGGKTIVVKKDKKYGLIRLESGEEYLRCDHLDKLYSISELGEVIYKAEAQFGAEKQTINLVDYIKYRKTVQAGMN